MNRRKLILKVTLKALTAYPLTDEGVGINVAISWKRNVSPTV